MIARANRIRISLKPLLHATKAATLRLIASRAFDFDIAQIITYTHIDTKYLCIPCMSHLGLYYLRLNSYLLYQASARLQHFEVSAYQNLISSPKLVF